jgi:predicted enzyme related to lactoylglutathione lyase
MNPVVHFEMPYDDGERVARFYGTAFGWQTHMFGAEMGNYVTAATAETDASGRPAQPGSINGGFYARNPDWPAQHPSVVIAVDDIHAAMQQVTRAGGMVLGEPMQIPGIGQYVSFMDTEQNRVSMLQPLPRTGAASG